jgi:hypothetical protein
MTSIQSQQTSRTDDHASRASRRAGKSSQNSAAPDAAAAFSSMVAASQRKLQADRLEAMKGRETVDGSSERDFGSWVDDDTGEDEAFAPRVTPPVQDNTPQGQGAQSANTPVSTSLPAQIRAMSEESPDWLSLASLLPAGVDDGVFEILMPNKAKIGVAVSDLPAGLSYLLTPEDKQLASRLRRHEMELEDCLKRRIRRNVKVVVL